MRTAPALGALVGVIAAAATPSYAQAEENSNGAEVARVPPKPQVELPKLLTEAVVPYPEGGRGDAIVILALTLDPNGKVVQTEAETGEEPFRSAATNAARTFKFSPATRDHVAVSSKIRFEVRFQEPEATAEEANAPSVKTAEVSKPSSPEPPTQALEVDVLGARTEPTVRRFSRAEVRELPGAFGDPFRAVEALPGVTPIFSGVPFFYVRGAPPGNVGYFLDGIQVPLLYHAGLGPSVIHPGLVESVDLYPGAYPSRYGRFGGGIVAGETKAPEPEWRGEGNIRLFDTGALVEGPFANGNGNVLAAGRYSYTAALLSLLAPNTRLEYWDYQGRVSYDLNPRRRLTVFTFGAFDFFGQQGTGNDSFFSTEFHRVDLRYDEKPSKNSDVRTAVTLGLDRTRGGEADNYVIDRKFGIRSEYKKQLSKSALLRAGVDSTLDHYSVEVGQGTTDQTAPSAPNPEPTPVEPGTAPDPVRSPLNPDPPTSNPTDAVPTTDSNEDVRVNFPSRSDVAMGVHADVVWKVAPRVTLTPGARLDYYSSDGASAVALEPRVTAEYQITQRLRLTNALGVAHQPPSFVIPLPGFQLGGLRGGLQRSVQSSFGGELELGDDQQLSITTFHNVFFNMTDVLSLVRAGDRLDLGFDTKTTGQAYGVELLFKRDLSRHLGGFVSYTLSRSIRYTDIGRLPASFDRTHVFNGALAYDLGRNWRGGGKLTFYTGSPGTGEFTFEKPQRLPPYYRLDVRLEKRWQLARPKSSVSFVFEILNTTLNKEAISQSCDPINGCKTEYVGPVTIPSIGVEGSY